MNTHTAPTTTVYDEAADIALGHSRAESRYPYDLALRAEGWKPYDTDQDAWYFGVWVHLERRQIFTYAEGDRSLTTCDTTAALAAELARMAQVYGDPPPAVSLVDLATHTVTHYTDKRPGAGL